MKIFMISHISDGDGIAPIILSNIVFGDIDYELVTANEVNTKFIELINNNTFDNYDMVYITDLCLNEELCNTVNNDQNLKNKIKIFDHHNGNLFANKYSFAKVIDTDEKGIKQSGTSVFYKYLLDTYPFTNLNKESIAYFVNLIRAYDTWEWSEKNNLDAKKLANLFDIYGYEYFRDYYLDFLKHNDKFFFNDKELFLLDIEEKRINNYIKEKKEKIISATLDNYKIGIVYASLYRSELGNSLAKAFPEYDFIIIVNIEHGISYRGIKDINLSEIASIFGGKGHVNSAGSPLPIGIEQYIIKLIFNDKIKLINKD